MQLDKYDNASFDRGRSKMLEGVWQVMSGLFFSSWLPGSAWRCALLRWFGANIGRSVVVKPRVRIKFPWRLTVGDYSWIGEAVWIDNLDQVFIGAHCCISQGVYLCTGNHRWDKERFDLETRPIVIHDHCWLGAFCRVAPGTIVEEKAVLTMGTIASGSYSGNTVHGLTYTRPR